MKKILFLITALALFTVQSFAVTDAALEWAVDTAISSANGFDTLLAANDSSTLLEKTNTFGYGNSVNKRGWTYYVVLGTLTGTSLDTSNLCISVDAYDKNDSLIGRAYSDTSVDRSGCYFFTLPINGGDGLCGNVFVGSKYRIKLLNQSAGTTTAETGINTIEIIRSRPVNFQTRSN